MKLGYKRKLTQASAFIISNLGFMRVLKTGFVCPFLYCHGCPFAFFGCPIGGIQHFITYGRFPFFIVGWLGVYGTLFGRAFCGWACPFGALNGLLSNRKARARLRTGRFWFAKYVILFLVLALAWFTLDTVFCKVCPSGSLFAAIPYHILTPDAEFAVYFYVHILTLALTLVLALLVSSFWCRYLCPLGAINGAFNKISLINIKREETKCKKCNICLEACQMGIDKIEDIGSSTDCTLCGRCVESCEEKALSFSFQIKASRRNTS